MSLLQHLQKIPGLLRSVAERRVQGKSWEIISSELNQPQADLRAFVDSQEADYLRDLKKARAEQRRLCLDTAVEKLRQQTQSSNEKISHSASNMLLRLKMASDRNRLQKLKAQQRQKLVPTNQTSTPVVENKTSYIPGKDLSPIADRLAASAMLFKDADLSQLMPVLNDMTARLPSVMAMSPQSPKKQ